MNKKTAPSNPGRRPKKSSIKPSKNKPKYRVRNWSEYNESLVQRGSLEFWIEKGWQVEITQDEDEDKLKKRGAPLKYSNSIIESVLFIGHIFHQRLRQTEGLVGSLLKLANIKAVVPNYSTLSRRGGKLTIKLPTKGKKVVAAILDSTGLKIYGEGEWKTRKHGISKRRTWVKLHVSIDNDGEIRAAIISDAATDDAKAGVEILDQQSDDSIDAIVADGAYDKRKIYQAAAKHQVNRYLIPPMKTAKIWKHGNTRGSPHPRDENLRYIRSRGKPKWKRNVGYHKRSLVENTMYRRKIIFGNRLYARKIETQTTEAMLSLKALNIMLHHGAPQSYAVP